MLVGNYCCIFILNIYQVLNHIKILKDLIDIKMKGYFDLKKWKERRVKEKRRRKRNKRERERKKKDKLLIKWNNEIKINFFFLLFYFFALLSTPLPSLSFLPSKGLLTGVNYINFYDEEKDLHHTF